MKDGYIRVASASIDTLIGNVKHNANEIKKVLKDTREKKAQVVVFPVPPFWFATAIIHIFLPP